MYEIILSRVFRSLGTSLSPLPASELRSGKTAHISVPLMDVTGKRNGGMMDLALKAKFMPPVPQKEVKRAAKPINQSILPIVKDIFNLRFLIHKCSQLTHSPCSAITVVR